MHKKLFGGAVLKLGVHISTSGDLKKVIKSAVELECEAIQIFSSNPRSWRQPKTLTNEQIEEFHKGLSKCGVKVLALHVPYLINLASSKLDIREKSHQALVYALQRAEALNAKYLVIHPGNHLGDGPEKGIKRISTAIRDCFDKVEGKSQILLETVSGAGTEVGRTFDELGSLVNTIDAGERIGICFDTCHVFASGYPLDSRYGIENTLDVFDKNIGLDKLKLMHANDSTGKLGSRLDRHTHIGKGYIGYEGFKSLMSTNRLKDLPVILETPKNSPSDDHRNLKVLRRFLT